MKKEMQNNDNENAVSLLRSMFRPNQDVLTVSTLGEVVKENDGDIDKCVDTILDLLNDPLEVARKEQMEEAQRELARVRQDQQDRLALLEQHVQQVEQSSNDDEDDDHFQDSHESEAFEAKIEELADRARQKVNTRSNKKGKKGKGNRRGHQQNKAAEKDRLAAVQQLTRDLEERAEEEARLLSERMAKLEEERRQRLEREINVLKDNHDSAFQRKVEEEVARRLESVEAQVRVRREQEVAAGANAAPAVILEDENEPKKVVELTVSADVAEPGDKVQVTWKYKRGEPHKSDWIAFYKGSRPLDSRSYYTTQYTDGEATGQLTFKIPNKLGVCEFRFFTAGAYDLLCRSSTILVGPRVTLTARTEGSTIVVRKQQVSGAASSYDWVAVYEKDEKDGRKMVGSYAYMASDPDATTLLKLPKVPGTYVARFFSGRSGYSPLSESNPITVENNDKLVAVPGLVAAGTPNAVAVTPTIESIPVHSRNWIAIFRAGDEDTRNFVGPYQYCPEFGKPIQFDAPREKGTFVARVFSRGTFTVVAESNEFTVQ